MMNLTAKNKTKKISEKKKTIFHIILSCILKFLLKAIFDQTPYIPFHFKNSAMVKKKSVNKESYKARQVHI